MVPWQWIELSSARIDALYPTPYPGASLVGAWRRARVDAWNGMAVVGASVYLVGVGGHADWGGNEGYKCDLAAASPVWAMLNSPTPDSQMAIDVTHYADGRPTSSHTYYSLHGDSQRNKIFRYGVASAYGTGAFNKPNVDAFDLGRKDWDAANTWPSVPESIAFSKSQAQHPITGDVYVVGNTRLWRFNRASATWTQLAAMPSGDGNSAYARASLVDTKRNRLVVLGDAYRTPAGILSYDFATDTWTRNIDLTGPYAANVSATLTNVGYYNAALDRYVVKITTGADVVLVDPVTLSTSLLATTGGGSIPSPLWGVHGKFVPVPSLGGYAYQPQGETSLWFLAGA